MDNATLGPACHNLAHLETQLLEFINEAGTIERLQQLAEPLLDQCLACIVRVAQESPSGVQDRFLDKVYEVCRPDRVQMPFHEHLRPTKIYPVLNASNIHRFQTLGTISSSIGRPPPILLISEGLEKSGTTAVASGGLMDDWAGEQGLEKVFIKVFRKYPDANMVAIKKVRA